MPTGYTADVQDGKVMPIKPLELVERLEKSQLGGKVVIELWCAPGLPTEREAGVLMREQATALREIADGLDAFSVLVPPGDRE